MKLLTLTSVVLMGLVINNAIRRSNARSKKAMEEFWEKERSSYKAPSHPVGDLDFIEFPGDLPLDIPTNNPRVREYQETLKILENEKVLDLSGITNTDIRMAYGNKNMEELSRADMRYTTLCRFLNNLAMEYMKIGYTVEAEKLLCFAISCGSDIKETYLMTGRMYMEKEDRVSLNSLIEKAEKLPDTSHTKKDILRELTDLKNLMDIVS